MLALLLLAAPPLTAAATVATHPGAVTGPGMERAPVRLFVSGPVTAQGRYRGLTAEEWAARFRRRTSQYQNARRVMLRSPHVVEAINLACATFGHCQTLWQLAQCESQLNPRALNESSGATGLYQILHPSTWRTTPFARFDVYSPYANALAAGYMVAHGRRGEWVC